jgi:hypothetical protein
VKLDVGMLSLGIECAMNGILFLGGLSMGLSLINLGLRENWTIKIGSSRKSHSGLHIL